MITKLPKIFKVLSSQTGGGNRATISHVNKLTAEVFKLINDSYEISFVELDSSVGLFDGFGWIVSDERPYGIGTAHVITYNGNNFLQWIIPKVGDDYLLFHPDFPKDVKDKILEELNG